MTISATMLQPANWSGTFVAQSGNSYTPSSLGLISAAQGDIVDAMKAGFSLVSGGMDKVTIEAPKPADLVSVVTAATPADGSLTIAAQPPHARKLQVRAVIGTSPTTAITAGVVTLSGTDQDGNAITENISIACTNSTTFTSKYAYAGSVAASLANYAASGSGTGNTLGIGVSNDFGVPTSPGAYPSGVSNLVCTKATKITAVLGTSVTAADDDAATATVDPVARTIAPTTAPSASGLINYEFTYAFGTIGAAAAS